MRIGMSSGSGFGGTLNYDLDKDGRNDKETEIVHAEGVDVVVGLDGKLHGDPQHMARSFRMQAEMNPRVEKCVKHMYLSYMPQDIVAMVNNVLPKEMAVDTVQQAVRQLGQERVDQIVNQAMISDWKAVLKDLGYENTQFLIVRHSEKSNPHSHCVLNMVDNDGRRLKDHGEMRRGVKACREITIEKGYCWGDHKSVSQSKSERPYERERQSMCKDIYGIIKDGTDAVTLQKEAARLGITVKYRTDKQTGFIKGVSFERGGVRFQGGKLDRSLSASRIFPAERQIFWDRGVLMTQANRRIIDSGGVVPGINNQPVMKPVPPAPPKYSMSKDLGARHRAEVAKKDSLNTGSLHKDKGQKMTQGEQPRQTERQEVKQSRGMRR